VSVRAEVQGKKTLAVRVADQGPGFAAELAFAEGHLGLANSRERAELLGGQLLIDSAPGNGTRVELRLPLPRAR
jgi:signal transduction histidine kinase